MRDAEGGPVTITAITYSSLNGQRVAQEREGEFTWIHADHLSSATRITDSTGLEVRRLAYAAFGEEAENQGNGDEPKYTYTGKEQDSTGLYYYGDRYYDPALSRFITADTVYEAGPHGLNRYSYALNNPILYRDPTGHFATNGPTEDETNPTCKGCITGSQAQFADKTATVHGDEDSGGTHPLWYWHGLKGGAPPNASAAEMALNLVSAGLLANPGGMAYMAIMALTYPYQQTAAQYYRETGHPTMEWIAENPDLAIGAVVASGAVARVISMKLGIPQALKALKGRLGLAGTPAMNTTGGIWKRLARGTRIQRSGNVWIKEVDPDASAFWRWWGRGELKAQARGLKLLGRDMAPEFSYTNGRLTIPHFEPFQGSSFEAWIVSLKVKWRLKTVFDDAQIRNMGAGGIVFDPISHPIARKILWAISAGAGGVLGSLPAIQSEMKK